METINTPPTTDRAVKKMLRRITNLENVVDALKDELREAREVARATEAVAERCRDEAERLALENGHHRAAEEGCTTRDERILSVVESLAHVLTALTTRDDRRPAGG